MVKQLIKEIHWENVYKGATYLYGSAVEFKEDATVFKNSLIAPGKPITSFISRTNYQNDRRSPDLPVLTPNKQYTLVANIETVPANRYYIQLNFFNRQHEKIHFDILRSSTENFTCPQNTFYYTITIFSAGCTELTFYNIQLYQETPTIAVKLQDNTKKTANWQPTFRHIQTKRQ